MNIDNFEKDAKYFKEYKFFLGENSKFSEDSNKIQKIYDEYTTNLGLIEEAKNEINDLKKKYNNSIENFKQSSNGQIEEGYYSCSEDDLKDYKGKYNNKIRQQKKLSADEKLKKQPSFEEQVSKIIRQNSFDLDDLVNDIKGIEEKLEGLEKNNKILQQNYESSLTELHKNHPGFQKFIDQIEDPNSNAKFDKQVSEEYSLCDDEEIYYDCQENFPKQNLGINSSSPNSKVELSIWGVLDCFKHTVRDTVERFLYNSII